MKNLVGMFSCATFRIFWFREHLTNPDSTGKFSTDPDSRTDSANEKVLKYLVLSLQKIARYLVINASETFILSKISFDLFLDDSQIEYGKNFGKSQKLTCAEVVSDLNPKFECNVTFNN